jgi:hypothetical protein
MLMLIVWVSTVSDLLMAFYLLVIGTQDCQFRGVYHKEAHKWMSSWGCTLIGMVAMTSSEVSSILEVQNHKWRTREKIQSRTCAMIQAYQTLKTCLSHHCKHFHPHKRAFHQINVKNLTPRFF